MVKTATGIELKEVPEAEFTITHKKFLNERFETREGNTFKVIGVYRRTNPPPKDTKIYYLSECEKCEVKGTLTSTCIKTGRCFCDCKKAKPIETLIGDSFTTKKGNTLTVTGVTTKSCGNKFSILSCDICSRDGEMWADGSITTVWSTVKMRGRIPCGCSGNAKLSQEQYKVLIDRWCNDRSMEFISWITASGKVNANTEFLAKNLKCPNHSTYRNTLKNVMTKWVGNPLDYKTTMQKILCKPDEYFIDKFMSTGRFLEGTVFTRNTERMSKSGTYNYWDYYCPKCSEDKCVKLGLCSGVFTATSTWLGGKNGGLSCRCSKKYEWNEGEVTSDIKTICQNEGYTFIGYVGGYKGKGSSSFKWICNKGHQKVNRVQGFLDLGHRCSSCNSNASTNGYYEDRRDEEDYLYILNFNNHFIKVGRSFDVKRRINELSRLSGIPIEKIYIESVYTSNHKTVFETEQESHLANIDFHITFDWCKTECFDTESFEAFIEFMDNSSLIPVDKP